MKQEASSADPKEEPRRPGTPPPCRLFVLLARENPIGVILRRGPTRWVQLIKWHTGKDTFEPGQWLHARVCEHRCDLSPAGDLLVYHAYKPPANPSSWTAVSKPPWFTALAVWPTNGSWFGGGLFLDQHTLYLDQLDPALLPKFKPPPFRVVFGEGYFLGENSGRPAGARPRAGENPAPPPSCMREERLWRTGWRLIQPGVFRRKRQATEQPEIWTKARPDGRHWLEMRSSLRVPGQGPLPNDWPYAVAYTVRGESDFAMELPDVTWADWDHQGHLVFAKEGRLFRQKSCRRWPGAPRQLADFNDRRPQLIVAPGLTGH